MTPCVAFQITVPALTDPVIFAAVLEFADPVVLATEGNKGMHRGLIAAFNVGAQELSALGEAKGVNGGSFGKDRVASKVGADFRDLFG